MFSGEFPPFLQNTSWSENSKENTYIGAMFQ